jgi:hypothetical protein
MIKDSLKALAGSARELFRNWRGLALLSVLYAALLASVYLFFETGVANAWQLVVSALTVLLVPLLFFVLQAMVTHFALSETRVGGLVGRALRDFLKILLVSLPLIALGVLFVYLLGKLQGWLPKIDYAEAAHGYVSATGASKPEPLYWQEMLVSSLWLLLLGVFLLLMTAHVWLATARDGLLTTIKRIHRVVGRSFMPQSVLIYAVGFFVFALVPYFVLFTRVPVSNGWAELTFFGFRLLLAFIFTLWGWTITLGALARVTPPPSLAVAEPASSATPQEPASVEPTEKPTGVEPQLQG